MYKYILFDIDNTLLDFNAAENRAIRATFQQYGIAETEENVSLYSQINLSFWKRLERKEITRDMLWSGRFLRLAEVLNIPMDAERAVEMNRFYLSELGLCALPIDGAEQLLHVLTDRGYDLYAVTNGNANVQYTRLEASNFKQYFKGLFISEEIGCSKPEASFFAYVFQKVGSSNLRDYLIVGDSLTSDIAGGINSGIDTCWYNPYGVPNTIGTEPTYTVRNYGEILDRLK